MRLDVACVYAVGCLCGFMRWNRYVRLYVEMCVCVRAVKRCDVSVSLFGVMLVCRSSMYAV